MIDPEPTPGPTVITLVVIGKDEAADGVVALTLAHPDGSRLPDWAPGAHLDLVLPHGLTRQYSLCGGRWDTSRYRVGVLRERDGGRGGSAYVHERLRVGDAVGVGGPRNHFPLVPSSRYRAGALAGHPPRAVVPVAGASAAGPDRVRRGGALGVAGADVLPDREHRRAARRGRGPGRGEDPDVPREAECLLGALVERVATIEIAGPTKRHHNNTLRAWAALPMRVGVVGRGPVSG
jgi:hypothetical protein